MGCVPHGGHRAHSRHSPSPARPVTRHPVRTCSKSSTSKGRHLQIWRTLPRWTSKAWKKSKYDPSRRAIASISPLGLSATALTFPPGSTAIERGSTIAIIFNAGMAGTVSVMGVVDEEERGRSKRLQDEIYLCREIKARKGFEIF